MDIVSGKMAILYCKGHTVNPLNCGHFGAQDFVFIWSTVSFTQVVGGISSPICVVITVIMLFDIKVSGDVTMPIEHLDPSGP